MPIPFIESYYIKSKLAQLANKGEMDSNGNPYTEATLRAAITKIGLTVQGHYQRYHTKEGTSASPYFNTNEYLAAKLAQLNSTHEGGHSWTMVQLKEALNKCHLTAEQHYVKYGCHEVDANGKLINPSNAFDANAYVAAKLAQHLATDPEHWMGKTAQDVVTVIFNAHMTVIEHYIRYGKAEGITAGINMLQTVPVVDRVKNDPLRDLMNENVPSNYNPSTLAPKDVTDPSASPIIKPCDIFTLLWVDKEKPIPAPGDNNFIPVPGGGLVDTNDHPILFVEVKITDEQGVVLESHAQYGIADITRISEDISVYTVYAINESGARTQNIIQTIEYNYASSTYVTINTNLQINSTTIIKSQETHVNSTNETVINIDVSLVENNNIVKNTTVNKHIGTNGNFIKEQLSYSSNGVTKTGEFLTDIYDYKPEHDAEEQDYDSNYSQYLYTEEYYIKSKLAQLKLNDIKDSHGNQYTAESLRAEIESSGLTVQQHYHRFHTAEKTSASPFFNVNEYLAAKLAQLNSIREGGHSWTMDQLLLALKNAHLTAEQHYTKYGCHELDANGKLINPSNAFDANAYVAAKLAQHKATDPEHWTGKTAQDVVDVIFKAHMTVVEHYIRYGKAEGIAAGISMLQTVPVVDRVQNDPLRDLMNENVPSNYNPSTPAPRDVTDITATSVKKPCDISSLSATDKEKPVPVPGDHNFVAVPGGGLVDTTEHPTVFVEIKITNELGIVLESHSQYGIADIFRISDDHYKYIVYALSNTGSKTQNIIQTIEYNSTSSTHLSIQTELQINATTSIKSQEIHQRLANETVVNLNISLVKNNTIVKNTTVTKHMDINDIFISETISYTENNIINTKEYTTDIFDSSNKDNPTNNEDKYYSPYLFTEEYYLRSKLAQLHLNGIHDEQGNMYTKDTLRSMIENTGLTIEEHYRKYHTAEKTSASFYFNVNEYLAAKLAQVNSTREGGHSWTMEQLMQALNNAHLTAEQHYIRYGAFEVDINGRLINPSNAFDANAYVAAKLAQLKVTDPGTWGNKTAYDVVETFKKLHLTAVEHYIRFGEKEGRDSGIEMLQTVPVKDRVPNDPLRANAGETVPSNYNEPSPAPKDVLPSIASPVAKPCDIAKLPWLIKTKPFPVPGDHDYVPFPNNGPQDTNTRPVIFIIITLTDVHNTILQSFKTYAVLDISYISGTNNKAFNFIARALDDVGNETSRIVMTGNNSFELNRSITQQIILETADGNKVIENTTVQSIGNGTTSITETTIEDENENVLQKTKIVKYYNPSGEFTGDTIEYTNENGETETESHNAEGAPVLDALVEGLVTISVEINPSTGDTVMMTLDMSQSPDKPVDVVLMPKDGTEKYASVKQAGNTKEQIVDKFDNRVNIIVINDVSSSVTVSSTDGLFAYSPDGAKNEIVIDTADGSKVNVLLTDKSVDKVSIHDNAQVLGKLEDGDEITGSFSLGGSKGLSVEYGGVKGVGRTYELYMENDYDDFDNNDDSEYSTMSRYKGHLDAGLENANTLSITGYAGSIVDVTWVKTITILDFMDHHKGHVTLTPEQYSLFKYIRAHEGSYLIFDSKAGTSTDDCFSITPGVEIKLSDNNNFVFLDGSATNKAVVRSGSGDDYFDLGGGKIIFDLNDNGVDTIHGFTSGNDVFDVQSSGFMASSDMIESFGTEIDTSMTYQFSVQSAFSKEMTSDTFSSIFGNSAYHLALRTSEGSNDTQFTIAVKYTDATAIYRGFIPGSGEDANTVSQSNIHLIAVLDKAIDLSAEDFGIY